MYYTSRLQTFFASLFARFCIYGNYHLPNQGGCFCLGLFASWFMFCHRACFLSYCTVHFLLLLDCAVSGDNKRYEQVICKSVAINVLYMLYR